MKQIYVRPAREGLLVAFTPHRPGQYIGMRHARDGEEVAHQVHRGHGYVATLPALVTQTVEITRRILQKDLVEVSAEEFAQLVSAQADLDAKLAAKLAAEAPAEPVASEPEQTPNRASKSKREGAVS